MEPILDGPRKRVLADVLESGAEEASASLSRWLGRPSRMTLSEVDEVELGEASGLLGPDDELVAACTVEVSGPLQGHLMLVFEDRSGLALADLLLRNPLGTAKAWGELEQSAATETANIVCCAYLGALADHLPLPGRAPSGEPAMLVPSPPSFRHEFAASLLEFALMGQAILLDRLLVIRTRFASDGEALNWSLLFVPSGESLEVLARALAELETR